MKLFIYTLSNTKNYDFYLVKCEYKLVFNEYQYCPSITSELSDNKTMCSRQNFLVKRLMILKTEDIISVKLQR